MTSMVKRKTRSQIDMEIRLAFQKCGVEAQCTLRPKFTPDIESLITFLVNQQDDLWERLEGAQTALDIVYAHMYKE